MRGFQLNVFARKLRDFRKSYHSSDAERQVLRLFFRMKRIPNHRVKMNRYVSGTMIFNLSQLNYAVRKNHNVMRNGFNRRYHYDTAKQVP